MEKPKHHILIACFPAQGQINPTLRLGKRLADELGARITISTAVHAHRRMFPNSVNQDSVHHPLISYIPYSNGYDDGYDSQKQDRDNHMLLNKQQGSVSLAAIVADLSARGLPVTSVIYTICMSWVAGIARSHDIPSFIFWVQSATTFAAFWHHFHGSLSAVDATDPLSIITIPGLPPMMTRDLPTLILTSILKDPSAMSTLPYIEDIFVTLDAEIAIGKSKPLVIMNTGDEIEERAIVSFNNIVDIMGIGPLMEDVTEGNMFKVDDRGVIEWLDEQEDNSVVYISFGSISVLKREQIEEISNGLRESGRAFLWVLRKDNKWDGVEFEEKEATTGMIVEWCAQARVLGHRAVGCFVTHCGWNSTVEGLICGVPAVLMPQWIDQGTNAWLIEREWGTGVRAVARNDGLVVAAELRRCLDVVMGEEREGVEIRRRAAMWKEKAGKAPAEGGSSHRNFRHLFETLGMMISI